jgi:hypothetical protein
MSSCDPNAIRTLAIAIVAVTIAVTGCNRTPAAPARITQFRVTPAFIPKGISGKLCYGVENATKIALNPPVEDLLPSPERCIDISPARQTTYTLTAYGADGGKATKSLEVRVGNPPPRLADLSANPIEVKRGGQVRICFKVENAKSVKASKGKLDLKTNCLTDRPRKTTTYKITAQGADREEDTGTVTVKVR